jgi:hypothetical protein
VEPSWAGSVPAKLENLRAAGLDLGSGCFILGHPTIHRYAKG